MKTTTTTTYRTYLSLTVSELRYLINKRLAELDRELSIPENFMMELEYPMSTKDNPDPDGIVTFAFESTRAHDADISLGDT